MAERIKIVDLELTRPPDRLQGLEGYGEVQVLVRWHGVPVGYLHAPVSGGECPTRGLVEAATRQFHWSLLRLHLAAWLEDDGRAEALSVEDLMAASPGAPSGAGPHVTVAVCTRDRPDDLRGCLASLAGLAYGHYEVLVVDNAPRTDATERLVREAFPGVRYVREPRPGLDWARNRAVVEARGEIVAYTDDDVEVDPAWLTHLTAPFADDPGVAAVTGLVVPLELETEAQILFERAGGFGRGFERKWYSLDLTTGRDEKLHHGGRFFGKHYGGGLYGTGANMAIRRSAFARVGLFDPALDTGTATRGGGDIEMYVRVLQEGYTLVYEPRAFVRHRHRREMQTLEAQLGSWGSGSYATYLATARRYPDERWGLLRFGVWWFWWRNVRRLLASYRRPPPIPRHLIWAELKGALAGPSLYRRALREAAAIRERHGDIVFPSASESQEAPPRSAGSALPPSPPSAYAPAQET